MTLTLLEPPQFGCPRCTQKMVPVAPWRYRCPPCDVIFEYQRAVWHEIERGVS